uniref:NADH dehydrogenase subunit 6 n=1 Tax=Rhinocola aceris TaxID=1889912 RepID=A0A343KN43_9HEMI|nr:NADH dehydrogenase subunit 6 [Rhinocola aceris]
MFIKITLFVLILISSVLPNLFNPLSMASSIFIQCLVISILSRLMISSSWIPLTIFLVTIGGLMIIFVYTTSINSNLNFKILKFSKVIFKNLILTTPFLLMNFNFKKKDFISGYDFFNMQYFKLFSCLNWIPTSLIFLYLILVLIILISLLSITKGPMRKKY